MQKDLKRKIGRGEERKFGLKGTYNYISISIEREKGKSALFAYIYLYGSMRSKNSVFCVWILKHRNLNNLSPRVEIKKNF